MHTRYKTYQPGYYIARYSVNQTCLSQKTIHDSKTYIIDNPFFKIFILVWLKSHAGPSNTLNYAFEVGRGGCQHVYYRFFATNTQGRLRGPSCLLGLIDLCATNDLCATSSFAGQLSKKLITSRYAVSIAARRCACQFIFSLLFFSFLDLHLAN